MVVSTFVLVIWLCYDNTSYYYNGNDFVLLCEYGNSAKRACKMRKEAMAYSRSMWRKQPKLSPQATAGCHSLLNTLYFTMP